jgi:nucleoside-diphosphate-sugar epimerase
MTVLVTGVTGFIGGNLYKTLCESSGAKVAIIARKQLNQHLAKEHLVQDFSDSKGLKMALRQVDTVLHCAARVHIMRDTAANALEEYRKVNVEGTLNLARLAAEAGVGRFIYLSSVKVNGEETRLLQPFNEESPAVPVDAYGQSKFEAEAGLWEMASSFSKGIVIVRPPLVYGPGVKANFKALMTLVAKGIPLPFGAIKNQRSFVALPNLVNFLIQCISDEKVKNQLFLISDGDDISTAELIHRMAVALRRSNRNIPVPEVVLQAILNLLGKSGMAQRLCSNLQVSNRKATKLLHWQPVVTMQEVLDEMARQW